MTFDQMAFGEMPVGQMSHDLFLSEEFFVRLLMKWSLSLEEKVGLAFFEDSMELISAVKTPSHVA